MIIGVRDSRLSSLNLFSSEAIFCVYLPKARTKVKGALLFSPLHIQEHEAYSVNAFLE